MTVYRQLEIKNSQILYLNFVGQTIGAKISGQEGDSPDYMLKFISIVKYKNLTILTGWEVGLEAAIL